MDLSKNGGGLSGDSKSLQNSQGGSTPTSASIDYKAKYIQLSRALTALKRGKPTDYDLEMLGCSIDEFWTMNSFITENEVEVRARAQFIQMVMAAGVPLSDAYNIRMELEKARRQGDLEKERIIGNRLFGGAGCI